MELAAMEKAKERLATEEKEKSSGSQTTELIQAMLLKDLMKQIGGNQDRRESNTSLRKESASNDPFEPTSEGTISKNLMRQMSSGADALKGRRTRRISDDKINLTRILLTGGPCAGKSTALAAISQDLTQLGYKVLVVPEAATIIMKGGAMIVSSDFTEQQGLMFQKGLMKLQTALEDSFIDIGQMV